MSQSLWERFYREYLGTLQRRTKWQVESDNLKIGDMVLLKMDNTDSLKWPLGRIVEVMPGKDGKVRSAKVRTANGEYDRGITQLALLHVGE